MIELLSACDDSCSPLPSAPYTWCRDIVREHKMTRRRLFFCCLCSSRSTHQGTDSTQFPKNGSNSRILLLLGQHLNDTIAMLVYFLLSKFATCLLLYIIH